MITLPEAFVRRVTGELGDEADRFLRALEGPAPVSVRFNPRKRVEDRFLPFGEWLDGRVPWCEQGWYLRERPVFTLDPSWHAGGYYVQEASSMFVERALRLFLEDGATRVLDMCAAPGGKSTLGASLLGENGLWVANEVVPARAAVLRENLVKWGSGRVVVTRGDPARFAAMEGAFDVVLVDAPCSGEGMFRKGEAAAGQWREDGWRACAERQRRVLSGAWGCLAPRGYLLYSTCTYHPGENERVLEWAAREFGAEGVEIPGGFEGVRPGDSALPCYRFYPHEVRGEGFFAGALRRRGGRRLAVPGAGKGRGGGVAIPEGVGRGGGDGGRFVAYVSGETVGVVPREHAGFVDFLGSRVGVLYKGCEVWSRGRPAHALAMWDGLAREGTRRWEVDLPTALRYLRREEVRLDAPAGEWIIVTYGSLPLGWVKAVGGRLNNYYPAEWRLRMGGGGVGEKGVS